MQYPVFPRFDNTATIKKLAQTVDLHIPKGKDKFMYEVGQVCQSSEIGVYKKGTQFTIKDRWMSNVIQNVMSHCVNHPLLEIAMKKPKLSNTAWSPR